ncbi:PLC-like phosphodiesterase [Xylariaceae sp. FL0016]|nr:PLC-like phosphodiesterase [Xylariaceae sp. FL0016]
MLPSISSSLATFVALAATVQSSPAPQGPYSDPWSWTPTTSSAVEVASSSAAASGVVTALAAAASSTTACNNSPDLCNRNYNNITHMGAHDSAFLRDESTGNSVSGNQYYNATVALDAGIRLLQAQVHDLNGAIELCHTTCDLLDAGTLEDWLAKIKTWMDDNPNEVVTILLVNSDDKTVSDFGTVFENSGIDKYGYTPDGSGWPTLQTMIDADTRLVTFIAAIDTSTSYSYLLNEWDYIFETAYDITSLSGFNCTLDRPSTESSASSAISAGMMPLMNHFAYSQLAAGIEIPDINDIATTNSPSTSTTGALGLHAETCNTDWGTKPTFVLVDFFNEGPAITTADNQNGIDATGRKEVDDSSDTETSAGDGLRADNLGKGALVAFLVAALVMG